MRTLRLPLLYRAGSLGAPPSPPPPPAQGALTLGTEPLTLGQNPITLGS